MFRARGRGGWRGRGGRRALPRTLVHKAQLRNDLRGVTLKNMSADPPTVVIAPWNSFVLKLEVKLTAGTGSTVNLKGMAEQLLKQLGLAELSATLECRIAQMRVWALGDTKTLILTVFDLQGPGDLTRIQQVVSDVPGRNRWAKVGYRWPAADFAVVHLMSEDFSIAQIKSDDALTAVVYLDVLWRSGNVPAYSIDYPGIIELD